MLFVFRMWTTMANSVPSVVFCPSLSWMVRKSPTLSSSSRPWASNWTRTWIKEWDATRWEFSTLWWPWLTTTSTGEYMYCWKGVKCVTMDINVSLSYSFLHIFSHQKLNFQKLDWKCIWRKLTISALIVHRFSSCCRPNKWQVYRYRCIAIIWNFLFAKSVTN